MGRSPCCEKVGLKKGPWTPEEDLKLLSYIDQHGDGSWRILPAKAGLQRCGKSCRLRWINYLRPDIKRGKFSLQEEQVIVQLHALLGNKWSIIAAHLPQRTDNEIKNFWNTHVKKKLTNMGIDPVTHKPISVTPASSGYSSSSHNQWETVCQESEAMHLPYNSTLGQTDGAWPKVWNSTSPVTVGDNLTHPNYNNGAIFVDHMYKSPEKGKREASIFQNPSENMNVLVDLHHHDHDVLFVGSDFHLGNNLGQDIIGIEHNRIGNHPYCSESDKGMITRGNCRFGYGDEQGNVGCCHGANFENNNVGTNYWDNIMNMVDDLALPFHDPPAASASASLGQHHEYGRYS